MPLPAKLSVGGVTWMPKGGAMLATTNDRGTEALGTPVALALRVTVCGLAMVEAGVLALVWTLTVTWLVPGGATG